MCAVHVLYMLVCVNIYLYTILLSHDQLLNKLSEMGSVVTEGQEAEFKGGKVRASDEDDLNSESDVEEDAEGSPLGKVEESQSAGQRCVKPFRHLVTYQHYPSFVITKGLVKQFDPCPNIFSMW